MFVFFAHIFVTILCIHISGFVDSFPHEFTHLPILIYFSVYALFIFIIYIYKFSLKYMYRIFYLLVHLLIYHYLIYHSFITFIPISSCVQYILPKSPMIVHLQSSYLS